LQIYVGAFAFANDRQYPLWKFNSALFPELCSHELLAHEVNKKNNIK